MNTNQKTKFTDKLFPTLKEATAYGEKSSKNNTPKDMVIVVKKLIDQAQSWSLSMQTNVMLANECFYSYLIAEDDKLKFKKGRVT
tara:strand:- start:601 stop:855 length:255 start_codon:yes stop_codon:yes gene_type:complete